MKPINRTYAPIQAFVEELARCGLTHAVTSPGSRNAPLLLTLAAEDRIRCVSVLDERSAGFVALGLAKATGRVVAITCTSGSAAANLLPALVEAREAGVALLVLTADRPPELREVGAGQAIDQLGLYGSHAKWFVEVGNHEPGRAAAVHHRALACRAVASAEAGRPGPVHLNFPLREPLAPTPEELDEEPWQGRADGRPWVAVHGSGEVRHGGALAFAAGGVEAPASGPAATAGAPGFDLVGDIAASARGALVLGSTSTEIADAAARLARRTGWPLLAEPTSGVRCGRHDRSHVVAHYDVLLRSERFAAAQRPELVIRIGDTPTSKPLRAWLAAARQVVIDPQLAWHEPTRTAEALVQADPDSLCRELDVALEGLMQPDPEWLASWLEADALVPPALAGAPDPCEPKALAALAEVLPDGAIVWLASSMPVRDVESFFPRSDTPLRFLANRGANGIDGTVSSAVGAAIAGPGRCFLLTGELALLHDLGGLLTARRHGIELTIVCLNNDGGGIFDFLPVAEHADRAAYEEQLATPHAVDLAQVAALAGLPHRTAQTPTELQAAVEQPALVEVRTDRRRNVELHREVFYRVTAELDARL